MITIVDYNAGNITSVKRALTYLGIDARISENPEEIRTAEKIIFPGVGNALSSMKYLNETGIGEAIKEAWANSVPILGICLGTQIIFSHSDEGNVDCLKLIGGHVQKFDSTGKDYKIPHIGWNSVRIKRHHPLFDQLNPRDEFYFVHSYYVVPEKNDVVLAACEYITEFPAVVAYKNIVAVQFHPEKSGEPGLSILERFNEWDGE